MTRNERVGVKSNWPKLNRRRIFYVFLSMSISTIEMLINVPQSLLPKHHYYYYYHFVFSQSNLINYLHILWLWIRLNRFYWRDTHHTDWHHPSSHKTWEFIKQIHRDRDQEDDNDTAGNKWLRAVYIVRRTEDQDHSLICSAAASWWIVVGWLASTKVLLLRPPRRHLPEKLRAWKTSRKKKILIEN